MPNLKNNIAIYIAYIYIYIENSAIKISKLPDFIWEIEESSNDGIFQKDIILGILITYAQFWPRYCVAGLLIGYEACIWAK